ncbi:MAG: DUF262 domain-containing protein [Blautia sp.]|nr:DUF262 domain-containing protein [Blautia sp.]MCM1201348.1 DUF262 domain-containing protein [Bacteroides fragilis]
MENFEEKYMEDEIELENAEELENMEYEGGAGSYIFKEVRVTKKDFSIYELLRKYNQGKLILDVLFQRRKVWDEKQKCELIESILMGLPLPIFYFKQLDNSRYVVVDGKQRLSALFEYLSNEFALKNLKILDFLNGKKFKDLKNELGIYQSQLEDYQVYSHVILPPTPDKILFDVFDRVNRGGTKLNKQEIRNALYQGRGMQMIHEITKGESFQKATRIKPEKDSRMKGAYLLTRFFAFYLYFTGKLTVGGRTYQYNGDCDNLIEISLKYLNSCEDITLTELKNQTENALENTYFYLGRSAFRKTESHPVNMNLFETTLFLMTNITAQNEGIKNVLREKLYDTLNCDEFLGYIGNGRDGAANVMGRFRLIGSVIKEIEK